MDPMSICNKFIDHLLISLRATLTAELFEKVENAIASLAKIFTPIAALTGALIAMVMAIKLDSLLMFLGAFAWVFTVILLYYIGSKLQNTCQSTVANNPFSIASQDLLDVLIVTYGVMSIISLAAGVYISIKTSDIYPFLAGSGMCFVGIYFTWILMHPHLVTTYVESSTSAGMDAIAFLSLSNKMFLRTNKLMFGTLPMAAAFLLINSLIKVFGAPSEIINGGMQGAIGFILLITGLLSPLMAYVFFLFGYMLLDVMRSILAIKPGTLSDIRPESANEEKTELRNTFSNHSNVNEVSSISPASLKKLVTAISIIIVATIAIAKGQEYYHQYQQKAEARRAEEARKKAEEEARIAQEAAENAKREAKAREISEFTAIARKYIGRSAQDLILDTSVNKKFREIFGVRTADFESYFSSSGNVIEVNGLILGEGCSLNNCDQFKALAVIDTTTGASYTALIFSGGNVRYFGISEENVPADVKKWAIKNKQSPLG